MARPVPQSKQTSKQPMAVSVSEAARQLGVCRNTIYALHKRGALRIVPLRESSRRVVPYRDLVALIEETNPETK